jgi:hypothetical protein
MAKRKDFSGILRHAEFENGRDNLIKANCQPFLTVFSFISYTKRCVTQFTGPGSELDEVWLEPALCERRRGRAPFTVQGIRASHCEAATVQTKQPPRGFARRLNSYPGNADFSNSAPR